MTMTPLDIFALTGIASGGIPIRIDVPLRLSEAGLLGALGWYPERRGAGDGVPQGTLLGHLAQERARIDAVGGVMTRRETRQYARTFLLLVCHELFESRGGNVVHFWWLPFLRHFDQIHNYDWGGFILAVLYDSMDQVSRHLAINLKGFAMLWEVRESELLYSHSF